MSYSCFEISIADKVAQLQLCRPEALNSMSKEFWAELPEIIETLDAGGEARAIVLSSTGKHFTAGMDLSVFGDSGATESGGDIARQRANSRRELLQLQETFNCLERARMPVLAAVQGGCIGGGIDMITACDMRYCSVDAFFCVQEINLGMTADAGTFPRLAKVIPDGLARELAYTGRRMHAAEAKAAGFVNQVFDDSKSLIEAVTEIAREIASKSPLAVWGSKELLNYGRDHTVADTLDYIATWQAGMFQPTDMAEVFESKKEKRAPAFDDLLPLKNNF